MLHVLELLLLDPVPGELKPNLDLNKPTSLQIYKHFRDFLCPRVIFSDTVYCQFKHLHPQSARSQYLKGVYDLIA